MGWFLVLAAAPLGLHAIALAYFAATERWAKRVARPRGLPDWMVGQAARNKSRVSRFILGSWATIAAAVWLSETGGAWPLGVAGFALGFNLVSFVVGCAGIVAQRRLVAEMRARIDRTLPERQDLEPASA